MSLYAKLQHRAAEGRPIRVGLIGAGKFGTMFLSQARLTKGMHVVAVADLNVGRAQSQLASAEGGNGGFGNAHFKSSTNRAPRNANPGLPGQERWVWLRLKLIADAGLVGLPNAGKSTFLASVSAAKPKIADYPFTTLAPQLGVVNSDGREFVLADIPGLIEGAHEGTGLGDRFLGHVERCRVLLHLVDGTANDVADAYRTVRRELKAYDATLARKKQIVALNKCDALEADAIEKGPIAKVSLPFRIRQQVHGWWVPAAQLAAAK